MTQVKDTQLQFGSLIHYNQIDLAKEKNAEDFTDLCD